MKILFLTLFPMLCLADAPFFQDLDAFHASSLTLRAEKAQLDSLSTEAFAKSLFWTPTVSAGVNRDRSATNGVKAQTNYWSASADWNLFRGGSDYFANKSADASYEAGQARFGNEQISIELSAATLIFKALALRDLLLAQKDLLKLKQDSLQVLRARYGQGKIPLQDVRKAEVDYSQQENLFREQELQALENETAIRVLFVNEIRTKDWPFSEKQSLASTERKSLSLLKATRGMEAAEYAWKSARSLHLPSVNLHLQYTESPLRTRVNEMWVANLALTVPLWNRFDTTSRASAAYAQYISAETALSTEERAEQERTRLLGLKVEVFRKNLVEAKANLERSEQLYKDVSRSFSLGRISVNDLFDEQTRLINSRKFYSTSRQNFHLTLLETCALRSLRARECLVP